MSQRDEYYNSLPNYQNTERIRSLLLNGGPSLGVATRMITTKNAQSYVRGPRKGEWFPLIYYTCLKAEYADIVKALLRKGADVNKQPDCDTYDYLPFVCNSLFLKTIAKRFKGLPDKDTLERSIHHRLNVGDSKRLEYLVLLCIIQEDTIKEYVIARKDTVIIDILKTMIGYLTYVYTIKATQPGSTCNLTEETTNTIAKFHDCIEFLVRMGATKTQELFDYCVEHYLFELLRIVFTADTAFTKPIYHTQKNSTVAAILRPLLNDHRYVKTCEVCGVTPDPDVFNYNIRN
jgi:hypothetical protein